ncbi:MAG: proline racemase family protein [Planctomycetes bacterium]|nr:proline racemase family protein [Candidatus Rokubacteria bacterium]MBI3856920.1 proline racemase family protein [Planctomycetota bacterium]
MRVVDSHTGGEPTRVVVAGGPDLGRGPMAERLARFKSEHDDFRSAVVNEPRGSDVVVGALLCEPVDPASAAGVLFFNNVGVIGMCGHGTIGLVATLAHLGRLRPGAHRIETCVGVVTATLHDSGEVSVANVPSRRTIKGAAVDVEGLGRVTGDVAWGGNWFFLSEHPGDLELRDAASLCDRAGRIRRALARAGIRGEKGAEIDHIEFFARSKTPGVQSRNFTLCPGGAYDRSPCGTGTSAKLACLVADGKLKEGETWRQESIVGSLFEGSVRIVDGVVHPVIRGSAYITAESTLLRDPRDPFASGIREDRT